MSLKQLGAGLALSLTVTGAHAFDLGAMTESERATFQAEVRAYLLEHPEVLVEAMNVLNERQAAEAAANDLAIVAAHADQLFHDGYSFVGGNPDGDVTLVEFLDYRCGYCKRAHPEVAALLKDDGNVRYVVKEYPVLGAESVKAARFALAVRRLGGDDAYKAVHDAMMGERGALADGLLKRLARAQGLDAEAVFAEMDAPEISAVLQANYALGQAMRIEGTPSFVFGSQVLRGYVPLAGMQQILKDERDG